MDKLADVVEVRDAVIVELTPGWSSPVARQPHKLKVAGSNPAPDFVVWILIGLGARIMAGQLAAAWKKIKDHRANVVTEAAAGIRQLKDQHAAEVATLRANRDRDVQELRDQLERDGLNDDDRAALAEIIAEAAAGEAAAANTTEGGA